MPKLVDMAKTPFHKESHLNDVSKGLVYYGRNYLVQDSEETVNCNEHGKMIVSETHNVGKVYICKTCGVMGFSMAEFLEGVDI